MGTVEQWGSNFQQVVFSKPWTWLDVSQGVLTGGLFGCIAKIDDIKRTSQGWFQVPRIVAELVQDIFKKDCSNWLNGKTEICLGICLAGLNWKVMHNRSRRLNNRGVWYYKLWQSVPTIVVVTQMYLTARQIAHSPIKARTMLLTTGILYFEQYLPSFAQGACSKATLVAHVWMIYKGDKIQKVLSAVPLLSTFFPKKMAGVLQKLGLE